METYTPVRGMIVCANNTGDYVKKSAVLAEIEKLLIGIDTTETTNESGWWETSVGAEFGAEILGKIRLLLLNHES
jgi:hypothetical protein